jgi:transcriptional regulator with XRE-family HTH domain
LNEQTVPAARATRRRRRAARAIGDLEARTIAARVGHERRQARLRRRLSQAKVAALIGVHQTRISQIERGLGLGASMGIWIAFAVCVGVPLAIATSRDIRLDTKEAGHLAAQETVLRYARVNQRHGTFELRTKAAPNATFIDAGIRDDVHRVLEVIEIWNRFDDLGAGVRGFKSKLADAEELAVVAGGDGAPYRVAGCWILRDTAANRALVGRFPAILADEFPGSSRAWVRAITLGEEPPTQPGILWIDASGVRLTEVRLRLPPVATP